MAHIVIMGAGIGGMPAAYEMRDMLPTEHKITVVSAVDYFQFVPSNPWVAVGWRKREEVILQIAPLLERKGIGFIAKPVTTIDAEKSQLTLAGGQPEEQVLPYDYLVIPTGPKLSFGEVPGAGPFSYTHLDVYKRQVPLAAGLHGRLRPLWCLLRQMPLFSGHGGPQKHAGSAPGPDAQDLPALFHLCRQVFSQAGGSRGPDP